MITTPPSSAQPFCRPLEIQRRILTPASAVSLQSFCWMFCNYTFTFCWHMAGLKAHKATSSVLSYFRRFYWLHGKCSLWYVCFQEYIWEMGKTRLECESVEILSAVLILASSQEKWPWRCENCNPMSAGEQTSVKTTQGCCWGKPPVSPHVQ